MYKLADIQKYLAINTASILFSDKKFDQLQQLLLEWAASLPSQTESEQASSIKKILLELTTIDLKDEQLLALMNIVVTSVEHLVASLHKHYIYEMGDFSQEQCRSANQVKQLYYLVIAFYDKILQRQLLGMTQAQAKTSDWRQWLSSAKNPLLLAANLYQTLFFYQKLLHEQALSYQPAFESLWAVVNQLYLFAYQQGINKMDISEKITARKAHTLDELYLQICLYSLLNIPALPRSNLLFIQRSLPIWSQQITATTDFQTNTRIFIDLKSVHPPEYLDASTSVNPYDKNQLCLFIDLSPLAWYLEQCKLALQDNVSHSLEYRLFERLLILLNYRYLQRQNSMPTKRSAKLNASIVTSLNTIHKHITHNASLKAALRVKSVVTKSWSHSLVVEPSVTTSVEVKTFDSTDELSHFRILQISSVARAIDSTVFTDSFGVQKRQQQPAQQRSLTATLSLALTALHHNITEELTKYNGLSITAPQLQIDSLLLLSRPTISGKLKESIGLVRWLTINDTETEIEWQILGHLLTACSLRLDDSKAHDLSEWPTIMIAADKDLQTADSLLVPSYHFRSHNRVILRIGESQKTLHLQRCLMSTNVFSQYEFEYLNE